jgi:hypothetical protein
METSPAQRRKKKPQRLTPEELRTFSGCKNVSTEEAEHIIKSLERLAYVLFEVFKKENDQRYDTK